MKKHILATLAIAGLTASAFGQGVIFFDGSGNTSTSPTATSGGQVFINGALDTTKDINAELLMNNGTSFVPVVTLLLSLGSNVTTTSSFGSQQGAVQDVTFYPGKLLDISGNGYLENFAGLGAGATGTFEVQGWLGNYSSYAAAVAAGAGGFQTATFTEVMTSTTGEANNVGNMPGLNIITPEPSVFALSSIGAAALMLFRRKKV